MSISFAYLLSNTYGVPEALTMVGALARLWQPLIGIGRKNLVIHHAIAHALPGTMANISLRKRSP
jgi:hypothetical protein